MSVKEHKIENENSRLDGFTVFEVELYVSPEHTEKVRELLTTTDERQSLTLNIEKLTGALINDEPMSDRDYGFAEYGVGIIECYPKEN